MKKIETLIEFDAIDKGKAETVRQGLGAAGYLASTVDHVFEDGDLEYLAIEAIKYIKQLPDFKKACEQIGALTEPHGGHAFIWCAGIGKQKRYGEEISDYDAEDFLHRTDRW